MYEPSSCSCALVLFAVVLQYFVFFLPLLSLAIGHDNNINPLQRTGSLLVLKKNCRRGSESKIY